MFDRLKLAWQAWGVYDEVKDRLAGGKMNAKDLVNLLVSALLAGIGVGWASHLAGAEPRAAASAAGTAAVAAFVQHLRQKPGGPPPGV